MPYPWYEILDEVESSLQQGDFIPDCPILIPPLVIQEEEETEIEFKEINSIILSQSCDLVNGKIQIVLVCPYYTLTTFLNNLPEDQQSKGAKKKAVENLRKGFSPGYHLLNKEDGIEGLSDYLVVDFRNVYGIQFDSLTHVVSQLHNRLLPPYREHLSQPFAGYFMRVGLPQDIVVEGF